MSTLQISTAALQASAKLVIAGLGQQTHLNHTCLPNYELSSTDSAVEHFKLGIRCSQLHIFSYFGLFSQLAELDLLQLEF